jgi:hypothetical protein
MQNMETFTSSNQGMLARSGGIVPIPPQALPVGKSQGAQAPRLQSMKTWQGSCPVLLLEDRANLHPATQRSLRREERNFLSQLGPGEFRLEKSLSYNRISLSFYPYGIDDLPKQHWRASLIL